MAYNHAEPSPQHQPYDYRAQPDDMAPRNTSWAPSPTYGPPRPVGDAYYETAPSRLPAPSGVVNGMSGSHPRPMPQEHQPQYHRPEYHHHHEYQQPPSPTYHQAPPQYQHYAPPAISNDPYRAPMPQPQYSNYEPPREPQRAPPSPAGDYDPYQEAREQHMMSRNLPPQMPGAPRVPNSNYDGKVAIPFTPQSLRIPAVRSGSTVPPAGAPWSATSQSDRSVKIEHLLSGGASQSVQQHTIDQKPAPLKNEYEIYFRQQPVAARCCGYGERDRRVIDPPPIVQLRINNPDLTPDEMYQRIHHPAYVVHCSIWCKDGINDETDMPSDYVRPGKRLMGSLVSSPFVGLDENGEEGCFFCFPDMSVRTPGPFRLRFALIVVDPMHRSPKAPIKSTIMSDVFQVYNAKDFPGMQASTPLTKRLKEQGCLISIKKGNEKSGGKSRRQDDSDEDDEEGGSSNKRKKSKKQR